MERDPIVPLPDEGEAWRIVYTINQLVYAVNAINERLDRVARDVAFIESEE